MIRNFLLVGLGGGIGSIMRYACSLVISSTYFPLSTLIVNIIGSLIIGLIAGISYKNETFLVSWKLFLATGICGGFTTFSAFSIENLQFLQNGKYLQGLTYITGSIVLGITAAWVGYKISGGS